MKLCAILKCSNQYRTFLELMISTAKKTNKLSIDVSLQK